MKKMLLLISIIIVILIISGCTSKVEEDKIKSEEIDDKELAISKCQELCKTSENLENGPCLSNNIVRDWVCDIAHDPRVDVDNIPENQCSAFREGKAKHFVELDLNCEVIKIY